MCGSCCGNDGDDRLESWTVSSETRGCTDRLALIVFVIFLVGCGAVSGIALANGRFERLIYGYDSFGNTCGMRNDNVTLTRHSGLDLTGRPYLFYLDPLNVRETERVCVKLCPDRSIKTKQQLEDWSLSSGNGVNLCQYHIDPSTIGSLDDSLFSPIGPCPTLDLFATTPLLNRCVPKVEQPGARYVVFALINVSHNTLRSLLADVYRVRWQLLYLCGLATLVSLVVMALLRCLAQCTVILLLVLCVGGSAAGVGLLWWRYATIKAEIDSNDALGSGSLIVTIDSENAYLALAIVASVLFVLLIVLIVVMFRHIQLVVGLFGEASRVMLASPCLMFQPLLTLLTLLLFFACWTFVFIALSTTETLAVKARPAATPQSDSPNAAASLQWEFLSEPATLTYFWWYHVFALFWISEFILAAQQMVVAGTVAAWYFTRNRDAGTPGVCSAIYITLRYHMGSLALGSFVIACVRLPRAILTYVESKTKDASEANPCAAFCRKCCLCCLWCLEKCLRYLNYNAYTIVAMKGTPFCSAARRAFLTLVANALAVLAINSVGDFVLFLGKVLITAVSVVVALLVFTANEELVYYVAPTILVAVFAFLISHCMLTVFEMVVDALLLCFAEDCQLNDGLERQYFAPTELYVFIKGANDKMKTLQRRQRHASDSQQMKSLDEKV